MVKGSARITEERMRTLHAIPAWIVPATTLLRFRDEDLDALALCEEGEYWMTLRAIISRIESEDGLTGTTKSGEDLR